MNMLLRYFLYHCMFLGILNCFGGFAAQTQVHTIAGLISIEQIELNESVICWNVLERRFEDKSVIGKIAYNVNGFFSVDVAQSLIACDSSQPFYIAGDNTWMPSHQLSQEDQLFNIKNQIVPIDEVLFLGQTLTMYDLLVEDHHNFCVGSEGIVVHNFVITIPFLVFGLGDISFATGALSVLTATGASSLFYKLIKSITKAKEEYEGYTSSPIDHNINPELIYDIVQPIDTIHFKDVKSPDPNGAQAPGKPKESDGFIPPKNWEEKREPHPLNGQYGWKDENGDYWIPTGHKPTAHGGKHWDVIDRKGRHRNVYPGGKVRK